MDESTISVVDQPVNHKLCCCIGVRNIPWPYGQAKLRCEELLVEHCEKGSCKKWSYNSAVRSLGDIMREDGVSCFV